MDQEELYEEIEVTTVRVCLNDTYDIEVTKNNRQYTHFHNLVAAFKSKYPIRNIINFKDGPLIDIDEANKFVGKEVFFEEDNLLKVYLDQLKVPVYCPICGTKYKKLFDFNDFVLSHESKFYSQKSIGKKEKKEKTFHYIDCQCCLEAIEKEYLLNTKKPLINPHLYQYHVIFAELLGLKLVNKINKDKRCLYPTDRLAYYDKNHTKITLLSVFHIANFIYEEFKKYMNSLNKNENDISIGLDILLTPLSKDLLDDSKYKEYRDFEKLLPKLANEYYFSEKIRQKQLEKSF